MCVCSPGEVVICVGLLLCTSRRFGSRSDGVNLCLHLSVILVTRVFCSKFLKKIWPPSHLQVSSIWVRPERTLTRCAFWYSWVTCGMVTNIFRLAERGLAQGFL